MGTIRLRDYFTTITAVPGKRGTRFRNGDRPAMAIFDDLITSNVMKGEAGDRAKEDAVGTTLSDINGHVVAATDAQAKANQAKKTDRTVVAQASQLPTNVADSQAQLTYNKLDGSYVQTTDSFNDEVLEVAADSTTTRNNYVHKWKASIVSFLQGFMTSFNDIIVKVVDINTRVSNNATAIGLLQGSVGGNFDQLLPIGSTTHHLNPAFVSDAVWKQADGIAEVDKWNTPGDSGSGEAVIYTMLKSIYSLENGATADLFKLPNLSNAMAYQEFDGTDYGLGKVSGKWGVDIRESNLPIHKHSFSASTSGGSHTHTWSNGRPIKKIEGQSDADSGSGNTKYDFQQETDISFSGSHEHTVSGNTGDYGSSSPDTATFTPPKILGGWLIKVA